MNHFELNLKQELRQAGAKPTEISELTSIANRLSLLNSTARKTMPWIKAFKLTALAVTGLAIGLFIVTIAQSASPTSLLYPVQKLSDAIAIDVSPGYRADVMMDRARQVNQLVDSHAPKQVILATLASYSNEAAKYRIMSHNNYAAYEYCKSNLEQAAAVAPANIRRAINSSLSTLTTT